MERSHAATTTRLTDHALLRVDGEDARAFLHAQLTNDVAKMTGTQARLAGWCSAKGRLLATILVVPHADAFLLLIGRDLMTTIQKRLSMFVLRSKVRIADAGDTWSQHAVFGEDVAGALAAADLPKANDRLEVAAAEDAIVVRVDATRALVLARESAAGRIESTLAPSPRGESDWLLQEIRAGVPRVALETQDLFVPQMVNFDALGAVDFRKGCYPGQEVVARAQYRGQVKRRMIRGRVPGAMDLRPGQDLYLDGASGQAAGTVVSAAVDGEATELLAVVALEAIESGAVLRVAPGGPAIDVVPLPYASPAQ